MYKLTLINFTFFTFYKLLSVENKNNKIKEKSIILQKLYQLR